MEKIDTTHETLCTEDLLLSCVICDIINIQCFVYILLNLNAGIFGGKSYTRNGNRDLVR